MTQIDGHWLKWEEHTEFFILTYVTTLHLPHPRSASLPRALSERIAPYSDKLINSVQILVLSDQDAIDGQTVCGFKDPCGLAAGGGDAVVWNDYRLSAGGETRLLFMNKRLNTYGQCRMIRRVLEQDDAGGTCRCSKPHSSVDTSALGLPGIAGHVGARHTAGGSQG